MSRQLGHITLIEMHPRRDKYSIDLDSMLFYSGFVVIYHSNFMLVGMDFANMN
jgi:hypothetical protein